MFNSLVVFSSTGVYLGLFLISFSILARLFAVVYRRVYYINFQEELTTGVALKFCFIITGLFFCLFFLVKYTLKFLGLLTMPTFYLSVGLLFSVTLLLSLKYKN